MPNSDPAHIGPENDPSNVKNTYSISKLRIRRPRKLGAKHTRRRRNTKSLPIHSVNERGFKLSDFHIGELWRIQTAAGSEFEAIVRAIVKYISVVDFYITNTHHLAKTEMGYKKEPFFHLRVPVVADSRLYLEKIGSYPDVEANRPMLDDE